MKNEEKQALHVWEVNEVITLSAPKVSRTCRELKIVKSHVKTVVCLLTASSPNAHVTPRIGNNITAAISSFLQPPLTDCHSGEGFLLT